MQIFDILYLLNVVCIVVSWRVATQCFNRGDKLWGNFNLGASALNFVIVVNHFFV